MEGDARAKAFRVEWAGVHQVVCCRLRRAVKVWKVVQDMMIPNLQKVQILCQVEGQSGLLIAAESN